jgi:NADP-dependent 3-hydroxy acid dehydrogenase YdfG
MAPRRVQGSTVVITGATSGIGRETAREFARAGARVVAAGRREDRLRELVTEIEGQGGEALAVPTDVADRAQVEALIARAVERFGAVDTLVNNAGVGMAARFEAQSIENFRRVMEVNFWGAVVACKAVLPRMRAQPLGGLIINIASIMGKRGLPFETAYCASKFALAGFSEALRTEVMSQGIDVSTIFPGAVESEIWETTDNRTGLDLATLLPKLPARDMARVIVEDARLPQPEIVMALDAQVVGLLNTVAPGIMDFVLGQSVPFLEGFQKGAASARPPGGGETPGPRGG